jgi:hypothetical protein
MTIMTHERVPPTSIQVDKGLLGCSVAKPAWRRQQSDFDYIRLTLLPGAGGLSQVASKQALR